MATSPVSRFTFPPLPDFPWDTIASDVALARSHPGGVCDLSVGTPVDPVPAIAQRVLAEASDAHGYPTVWGTPGLRRAIIDYSQHRWNAPDMADRNVLPVIGAKELVGWLPTLLGLGSAHTVIIPSVAYPTYEVGALMAGTRILRADHPAEVADESPSLVWINSPANPTGEVMGSKDIQAWIAYARQKNALLAADECYAEFGWDAEPVSILDQRINSGSLSGLLAVQSLSKRSNLAGYRAGFVVGDDEVVMGLVELRKHLGMMVATPVQEAMMVLLGDHTHVETQRDRYIARRDTLTRALVSAGFQIDSSQGGLYLWATRGEDGRTSAHRFAELGIIVAPGDFYGPAGASHVRIALTATDERIEKAAARLITLGAVGCATV